LNTLVIDTSTNIEIISLKANQNYFSFIQDVKKSHSRLLFQNIDNLLKKAKIDINEIELIGVGIGPGSFTGLRISSTTARMLAQTLEIPIVPIATQDLFAYSVNKSANKNIMIAFDAKKGKVFGSLYKIKNNQITKTVAPGDFEIDFLMNKIDKDIPTEIVGDGGKKYLEKVKKAINKYNLLENFTPSGEIICEQIISIYQKNKNEYNDFNKITPDYSRKSDAEIARGY